MTIFLFFVGFIPSITKPDVKFRWFGISLWFFIESLSIYFAYDVFGNYLYYRGIWKNPPFAKSSIKIFWKDMKHGKLPFLVLPEISNNGQVMKIHLIYRKVSSRGVVVEIDRAEKFRVDNLLKELREKGAKNIKFIYKGYRICGATIKLMQELVKE